MRETPVVLLPMMYIGVGSKSIDRGAAGSEVTGSQAERHHL